MADDRAARRLLPVVVAITGLGVLTFAVITPALPDLADELGVSRGAIGFVQGAVAVPGIFLAVVIGYVADRRGRRLVAVASLAVFGVAGLAGFWVRSFWPLVVLRAIQGIGTSGMLSLGVVVVGDLFPPGTRRRWALGINSAGITITAMISPVVGGLLADGGAFRPFLLFGLALPMIPFALLLPGRPVGDLPARPLAHLGGMVAELRENHRFSDFAGLLPFSLVAMVVFVGFGFTVTPLYLERVFDIGASERGLIQAILSVGSSISTLNTARLAARFSPARVLNVSFVGIVAGFAVLAVAPSLWVVGAGLFVLGAALGLIFPLFQDFVASSVTGAFRGAAVGTWISSIRLGQSVGPVAGSGLAEGIGERPAYWLASVAMALLAVGWRPVRRLATGWLGPSSGGYRSVEALGGPAP